VCATVSYGIDVTIILLSDRAALVTTVYSVEGTVTVE